MAHIWQSGKTDTLPLSISALRLTLTQKSEVRLLERQQYLSGSAIAHVTHAWIVKRVVVRYIDDVNYIL